jgi:hypothetical protein
LVLIADSLTLPYPTADVLAKNPELPTGGPMLGDAAARAAELLSLNRP